jgi:hypothetical protein
MAAPPTFLETFSPWTSRTSTPKPGPSTSPDGDKPPAGTLTPQQGGDHRINHRHRVSMREYPSDCPPLSVRWFYAVDVPKRKPAALLKPGDKPKPLTPPKKFAPFSGRDSRSIEAAFQRLAEQQEKGTAPRTSTGTPVHGRGEEEDDLEEIGSQHNTSINNASSQEKGGLIKVPVNEDYLFDVDIDNRELAPAYWLGHIYEVRRGTWFYHGASSRPCEENLATQLEEGYIKAKPWRYEVPQPVRTASQSKRPASWIKSSDTVGKLGATNIKPPRVPSVDASQDRKRDLSPSQAAPETSKFQLQTHRLFGAYMNSVVTYQDETVAWLLTDDFLSRMSSSMYQRFAGGGHLGGIKVVRGFVDGTKSKDTKLESSEARDSEERGRSTVTDSKLRSGPASNDEKMAIDVDKAQKQEEVVSDAKRAALERRMATIVGSPAAHDPDQQEEEARKREEQEIQDDYRDEDGDDQGREIEHLVLVTHGIGQRLGLKMESLNFIHDVNVFRKTLKSVYETAPDLQALNAEVDKLPKNCRIQVLPVVWRHLLDFPQERFKKHRKEQDLTEVDSFGDDFTYPQLADITIEGVPAIRNLVEDLFLDILLYQSAYREHIAGIVQRECNRVHRLFVQRNPQFHGKVSLVGHSLGSAVMFDLLCKQKDKPTNLGLHPNKSNVRRLHSTRQQEQRMEARELPLDFDVEDFYCLGSPIGLFQMIKGRTIAGRSSHSLIPQPSPMEPHPMHDPFLQSASVQAAAAQDPLGIPAVSSPKCGQVFNIFHPTDPIAYRIEPLISPAMKALKPQPLPYIKRGIFGVPAQGLTSIGARVGQSVSGLWSNITTGVASSLLNRSLGLSHDPQQSNTQTRVPLSLAAVANLQPGGEIKGPEALEEEKRKARENAPGNIDITVEHPATLIDTEIETLYSGFQKSNRSHQGDHAEEDTEWSEAEERARQMRREEAKVRALNSNGRVDFSIQEYVKRPICTIRALTTSRGVFDISLIASLASHLSYWSDEDVCHFMISQLLSRQRVVKR